MADIFQKFIDDVKINYPKNKDKILQALDFATKSHYGVSRKSGEPYIIHPIAVSQILMDNQMDYSTVIAGLLHDVVEDTEISLDEIAKLFGKTVAKLVDGVTKIDEFTIKKDNLTEDDSRKRLILAMGDDIRVIFIKLADRLHNMRTIKYLAPERQEAISKETQELFIPIAELLGVRNLRSELQALTFECLFKDSYEKIKQEQDEQLSEKYKKIIAIDKKINDAFNKRGLKAIVSWWPERYYSIYKKIKQPGFNKAHGVVLFKIIVPTIDDCYKALGIVHQLYKPIPSQIKDYIASPKINGYQSLQSVVLSEDNSVTFSVMIRTPEMNRVCEYGVFALASSKDAKENFNAKFERYNKLKNIISEEIKSGDMESSLFVDAIKKDISSKSTWVFSSKFKPTKIESSTPTAIDFAYVLGEKIGHNAISAVVNGKQVSLGAQLKSGDVVEIVSSSVDKAPCRAWLSVAKTQLARNKIREYFVINLTKDNVKRGKAELVKELRDGSHDISSLAFVYEKVKNEYAFVSFDDMLATIGSGGLKASQITGLISNKTENDNALAKAPVVVENETFAHSVVLSKCCCPIVGDEIVAVKSKNGLSIHRSNCLNLKYLENKQVLNANWKPNVKQNFEVSLKITAKDSIGFAAKVLGAISSLGVDITKIVAKEKGSNCELKLMLKVNNAANLEAIIQKVSQVDGVKTINRSFD